MSMPSPGNDAAVKPLSTKGRWLVLTCGFLGWLCAGCHMSLTSISMRPAAIALLDQAEIIDAARYQSLNKAVQHERAAKSQGRVPEIALSNEDSAQWNKWDAQVVRWFTWLQCSFLFGAAAGGLIFGWLGDRFGRSKALAASILTYSMMSGLAGWSSSPWHLLAAWFIASTGVGGIWPNGVALISEAWSELSRPMTAGVIGTAANIGIFTMSTVAANTGVTPDNWQRLVQLDAAPFLLGLLVLVAVPESPRWLASRDQVAQQTSVIGSSSSIFRPPLLTITLIGMMLATIPAIGGWGSANWMVPWADSVGSAMAPPNPGLKAQVQQARSLTGIVGSFLGGWFGSILGRRRAYALISILCLATAQYAFWFVHPLDPTFLVWVGALGFFSGLYFGWLPLCLPELFPVKVRSTGAGVCFNFGRILTAITVLGAGALTSLFHGDYARIGQTTSLVFALGLLAIAFAPETSDQQLKD